MTLTLVKHPANDANPEVIALLEEYLQAARNGELRAVVISADTGSSCRNSFAGHFNAYTMMGQLNRMIYMLQQEIDSMREEL